MAAKRAGCMVARHFQPRGGRTRLSFAPLTVKLVALERDLFFKGWWSGIVVAWYAKQAESGSPHHCVSCLGATKRTFSMSGRGILVDKRLVARCPTEGV